MKETKDVFIKVRVSEAERAMIKEYAAAHNLTISELIRMSIARTMGETDKSIQKQNQ